MNEDKGARDKGSLLRAGRTVAGALLTPSGASWARPRRRMAGRVALLGLLAAGGAAAYAAGQSAQIGGADRAQIESVVRDYILDHPEVVREAMARLEQKRVAALVDENRPALETPFAGAWEGAAKPQVTLVAFMDYACGYCRATLPTIARLLKDEPGLRVVYHELPIITQGSVPAARVSLYAAETGRFSAFHQAMYAEGSVEKDAILTAAKQAGLDPAGVKTAMEDSAHDATISQNVRLAQSLEAEGTPLLVVGDRVFYGAVSYDTLKTAIDAARKAS